MIQKHLPYFLKPGSQRNKPNLIWTSEIFGSWKIWAPRMLVPAWKCHVMIFKRRLNFLGTKFLGDQISWGPNFLGTKKVRGPNEIRDHFSYSPLSMCLLCFVELLTTYFHENRITDFQELLNQWQSWYYNFFLKKNNIFGKI